MGSRTTRELPMLTASLSAQPKGVCGFFALRSNAGHVYRNCAVKALGVFGSEIGGRFVRSLVRLRRLRAPPVCQAAAAACKKNRNATRAYVRAEEALETAWARRRWSKVVGSATFYCTRREERT